MRYGLLHLFTRAGVQISAKSRILQSIDAHECNFVVRRETQISTGVFMGGLDSGSHSTVPFGRIIDFEKAELRRLPFQDSLYLWVRGRLPVGGFEARLAPRIYHGRPDYWGIEVAAFASVTPDNDADDAGDRLMFERSVPLTGITGTRGVKVIGANQVQRIDIDGRSF
jgi:hypothetical protein